MVINLTGGVGTTIGNVGSSNQAVNQTLQNYVTNSISGGFGQRTSTVGGLVGTTVQAYNNVLVNTQPIANALVSHNQQLVSSIQGQTRQITQSLMSRPQQTIIDTSSIKDAVNETIRRSDKTVETILDKNLESIREITVKNTEQVQEILDEAFKSREITKEQREFAKDFVTDFWDGMLVALGAKDFSEVFGGVLTEPFRESLTNLISVFNVGDRFKNVLDKLKAGEYSTTDEILLDLTQSPTSTAIINAILGFFSLVPVALAFFQASNAKELVELNRLALKEGTPNIPTWLEIMSGVRRGVFGEKQMKEMMLNSGWAENDIMLLFDLSQNLPSINELFEMFRRGFIDENKLQENIEALGFTPNWSEQIKKLAFFQPTPQDVIRFMVRDVFDEGLANLSNIFEGWDNPDYLEWARKAGIDEETARLYWGAHWILPSVNQGYEMLFRQVIDRNELEALFRAGDIAPAWRQKLLDIAYRVPTRVDTRNMFIQDVISEDETLDIIKAQGYNDRNANFLLSWYKDLKSKKNSNTSEIRNLSQSVILKSVKAGILSDNDALAKLKQLGYSTQDGALLLLLNNSEAALENEVDYLDRQRLKLRQLGERAYKDRTISRQEANNMFIRSGLNQGQTDVLLSMLDTEYELDRKTAIMEQMKKLYIGYEIDTNAYRTIASQHGFTSQETEKQLEDLEPFRHLRYRDLTTAQIQKLYLGNHLDINQTREQLRGNGYSEKDIDLLFALWGTP